MPDPEVRGFAPDRFVALREAFAANLEEGLELGARFTVLR